MPKVKKSCFSLNSDKNIGLSLPANLTLSGVLERAPFFRPAAAENDPTLLGWWLPEATQTKEFLSTSVKVASAEAIVALGVIRSVMDANLVAPTRLDDPNMVEWARLLAGTDGVPEGWAVLPNGIYATRTWQTDVRDRENLKKSAETWVRLLGIASRELANDLNPLLPTLHRVVYEALLNVHEHAYASGENKPAWLAATVMPVAVQRELLVEDDNKNSKSAFDPREIGWLDSADGTRVLEIAIGDSGTGIPRTLAEAAAKHWPDLHARLTSLSAGTNRFTALRAELHADLCDHAFRHYSTRKKEFTPPFLKAHWRGLYRCYRQIVDWGGCIALTSGRGRAGYTARGRQTTDFKNLLPTPGDFPGTLWVIRLPLPASRITRSATSKAIVPKPEVRWSNVIAWQDPKLDFPRPQEIEEPKSVAEHAPLTAIALPFSEVIAGTQELQEYQIATGQLVDFLANRGAEEDAVPVFCFGKSPEDWRRQLQAVEPNTSHLLPGEGPPRLVGWMELDGTVQWGVAGVIAEEHTALLQQMESSGEAIVASAAERHLAEELAAHHPRHLHWDSVSGTLRLPLHGARLALADHTWALRAAWSQHWARSDVRKEVVTEKEGYAILLATGTRVSSHFSVFRLLHQSRLLTAVLGNAFARQLATVLATSLRPAVVIDQPASRYICHALLEETSCVPEVFAVQDIVVAPHRPAMTVVFTDAVFQGRTVSRTIADLRRLGVEVLLVVTCADLRRTQRGQPIENIPVISLVDASGFTTNEITDPTGLKEIQTDAITHVVVEHEPSRFLNLASKPEPQSFLDAHPELFAVGYHRLSGRVHTVTLPVRGFVKDGEVAKTAASWMAEEIRSGLESLGVLPLLRDVAFFTRFDAKTGKLEVATELARALRRVAEEHNRMFLVRLPAAYHESHAIFPQPGSDLFVDCKELEPEQLGFDSRRVPADDYIGIYLDDAAVTGNSLRDFVHRVTHADRPRPSALLALAIVNRLSPGEVRFLDLCDRFGTGADGAEFIPFAYRYVFNLQVRSRPGRYMAGHPQLEAVFESLHFHHPTLRRYVGALRERWHAPLDKQPALHLFCPKVAPAPVSTAAMQLRHLLALNQQNEPVVLEIMQRLQILTNEATADPSVLTVLALEPSLLSEPPLRQFGREMLVSLAIRVLQSDKLVARKSDGLAVLAAFPRAFIDNYRSFAPAVLADTQLFLQLATHLLAHVRPATQNVVLPTLENLSSSAKDRQFWLHRILSAADRMDGTVAVIRTRNDAQRAIHLLGSHFSHHARSLLADWDMLEESLRNLTQRWRIVASIERRRADLDGCRRGAAFATHVVLPCFPALLNYLNWQGPDEVIEKFKAKHAEAQERLVEFQRLIPADVENFDHARVKVISAAFQALLRATWFGTTTDRLLCGDAPRQETGPLAQALPQVFSAPASLLARIGESVIGNPTPFVHLRELRKGHYQMTIVPVPIETLEHIFRLLLLNVVECGDPLSLQITPQLQTNGDGTLTWRVTLTNTVTRQSNPNGQHLGLPLAEEDGRPYGVVLNCGYQRGGREYVTVVSIPDAIQLDQTIPRFEP